MRSLQITALTGIPMVEPGDDISKLIQDAMRRQELFLRGGDIVVVAQKIISKAENRYAYLRDVEPGSRALELAKETGKDPRFVQLILNESTDVLRQREGLLVVEHKRGYVHANAGIDRSNISQDGDERVLLLPENPDLSAARLLVDLSSRVGADIAVIISDSAGRAWRNGIVGFALGTAGIQAVSDRVGSEDLFGKPLEVTEVAVADELAAAASLLMGQGAEAVPVVHIRGLQWESSDDGSEALIRDRQQDLFR